MKLLLGPDVLADVALCQKPYIGAIRRLFIAAAFGDVRLGTTLEASSSMKADYLITRDEALVAQSVLPAMTAGDFLALLLCERGLAYEQIPF